MTVTRGVSALALATLIAAVGCSAENEPATGNNGNGAATGGSSGNTTSTGGSGGTAPGASGGSTSATGGAASGSGGADASGGAASGSGGADASGGAASGSGGAETLGDPPCDLTRTLAGEEIKKGTACTPDDLQLCWRKCGPQGVGWKSETCSGGVYAEGDCQFPAAVGYECFAIPDTQHAECPTDPAMTPQASEECSVPECNPCNVDGQYLTSSGEAKVGYCVCQPPNSAGTRTWSCASGTAWPCPFGMGC